MATLAAASWLEKSGLLRLTGRPHGRRIRRVANLGIGDTLRILNGERTRITVAAGLLWITEEGRAADIVLATGDRHDVQIPGKVLATAYERVRLILEVPADAALPRSVDVVSNRQGSARRIGLTPRLAHWKRRCDFHAPAQKTSTRAAVSAVGSR